jgi:ATP-dependent phosphoenolpyruvate carboxykinase
MDIRLETTLGILDSMIRGGLEQDWMESISGLEVPAAVRVVDDVFFHPEIVYSRGEFEKRQTELNRFRRQAIEAVGDGLHPKIRRVFE